MQLLCPFILHSFNLRIKSIIPVGTGDKKNEKSSLLGLEKQSLKGLERHNAVTRDYTKKNKKEEKKNHVGNETTPYINQGKGDILAQSAASLLRGERQEKGRKNDKPVW